MNVVDIIKATVGPLIVILVAGLAYAIVHGDVTERNSFGLAGIVGIISALATAYAMWAYGYKPNGGNGGKAK